MNQYMIEGANSFQISYVKSSLEQHLSERFEWNSFEILSNRFLRLPDDSIIERAYLTIHDDGTIYGEFIDEDNDEYERLSDYDMEFADLMNNLILDVLACERVISGTEEVLEITADDASDTVCLLLKINN